MSLLDLIYPKSCFGCEKGGVYVCKNCLSKVGFPKPICCVCYKPSIDWMTHEKCKKPFSPDYFVAVYKHDGVIREALRQLKYKHISDAASEIAKLIVGANKLGQIALPQKALLVPVPLHKIRQNFRGFNQAEVVGKLLAEKVNWEFLPDVVLRKKNTKPQVQLRGKDRRRNLLGAFALNENYALSILHSALIVFDDVYTTGSTVKEVVKVLKRNGAKSVWGLCVAK